MSNQIIHSINRDVTVFDRKHVMEKIPQQILETLWIIFEISLLRIVPSTQLFVT